MAAKKKANEIGRQPGNQPKGAVAKRKGPIWPQPVATLKGTKLARPVRKILPPRTADSLQGAMAPLPSGYAELLEDLKSAPR